MSAAISQLPPRPPLLRHSVTELGRAFLEMGGSALLQPLSRLLPRGDGHSVVVLPSFMASDSSTAGLRRFLTERGYCALPWGLGRHGAGDRARSLEASLAARTETEERVAALVEAEYLRSGRKVTLIGWSLGGLVAAALAHRYPQWLRQVITLGTPYGDPRGTALYRVMSGRSASPVDEKAIKRWVRHAYRGTLQVPVLALYSKTDGIVGSDIALCQGDARWVRNVAIPASHIGFPFNPLVRAAIARELAASPE
ncbi:alpha/beta hydrolase [Haliea sp. E1-2-M8]|uniref:esterase/lipase family protein n=1 Tax=Haliea sp. E1-2-M8 TaxID=3064706 RepID=UPI00272038F6|nr:alpha/beta hydrolase [Haliea sp. E1-2-M8]MDO8863448.1 alpha/beta hydrolase [Haliea sp. E1-2-M8]